MQRIAIWLLLITLGTSSAVHAETAPAAESADKMAAISRLLDTTGAEQMGQQIIDQMLTLQQQSKPGVPAEVWAEIRGELDLNDFRPAMIEIYDRHFSAADIEGLLAFYQSDLGQRLLAKQPDILQDSVSAGQVWAGEVQEKLLAGLRSKGFAEGR